MPLARVTRRSLGIAVSVVAAAVVAFCIALFALSPTGSVARVATGPGLLGAAVLAALACAVRLRREQAGARAPWALLLIALVLVAARVGVARTPSDTVPTITDCLDVAALGCLAAGIAALPGARAAAHGTRLLLDAVGVAAAVVVLSGGPMFAAADRVGGLITVASAHLIAHVLVATAALVLLSGLRLPDMPAPGTLAAVAAAALVAVAGDAWETTQRLSGVIVHPVASLAWLAATALLIAAASVTSPPSAVTVLRERAAVLGLVLPSAVTAASVLCEEIVGHSVNRVSLAGVTCLAGALIARLTVAQLDGLAASRLLEAKVAERTLGLVTREQWFRSLVQNSSDVLTVVDADGVIRYQSPAVTRVFGHDAGALVGTPITYLMRSTDARRLDQAINEAVERPRSTTTLEFAIWHRDGRWCETETAITSLLDDQDIRGLVFNTRDISERKRLEDALSHQAFHDNLTGLVNRVLFQERVAQALQCAGDADRVGVLFLDLDGFKSVNDTQGHAVGDQLLGLVAERLHHCVRPTDTVARLGGDEFAVLVTGDDSPHAAVWVAERIREAIGQPFVLDGRDIKIGVSTGIALNASAKDTADALLRNADVAMYKAKGRREGSWVRFEPGMRDALVERVQLQNDLEMALARGELVPYFQPTVELPRGHVVGAEALLRWHHPERGLVGPEEFIPVAEEAGLISAIGEWVLLETCRVGARWQRWATAGNYFSVAVNISARQFGAGLVESVQQALFETGLPAAALVLEITESVLMDRTDDVLEVLHRLKALGVRLAVDDFGTGYSSLSYLSRFPVDVLKMDKSFVESVARPGEQTELAKTIIQLGQTLHLSTVAEGVETQAQYAALRAMGCAYGQGYLFARPLPASGIDELLTCRLVEAPAPDGVGVPDLPPPPPVPLAS